MNKQNKLARNAIRARKAKNKRVNEQDKPKKGKRWLIRLGAFMGCLLLVSALVVPAFADLAFTGTITDDYYSAFIDSCVPEIYHDSDVLTQVIDAYRDAGDSDGNGLFDCGLLTYNNVSFTDSSERPSGVYDEYFLSEDSHLHYEFPVDYICFDITFLDSSLSNYKAAFDNGLFAIDIRAPGDSAIIEVSFTAEWDTINYEFYFHNLLYSYPPGSEFLIRGDFGMELYEGSELSFYGDVSNIEIAYTVLDYIALGVPMVDVSALHTFFLVQNQYAFYYPTAFANGYKAGKFTAPTYEQGFSDGRAEGYNNGKNEGYVIGKDEGYDLGKSEGFDKGYTEGFYDGRNSSDSANLGRNLIGDTFSAPLEGLRQFTLIEWITDDGRNISINLMSVLSAALGVMLVIWFIKLFAGG